MWKSLYFFAPSKIKKSRRCTSLFLYFQMTGLALEIVVFYRMLSQKKVGKETSNLILKESETSFYLLKCLVFFWVVYFDEATVVNDVTIGTHYVIFIFWYEEKTFFSDRQILCKKNHHQRVALSLLKLFWQLFFFLSRSFFDKRNSRFFSFIFLHFLKTLN